RHEEPAQVLHVRLARRVPDHRLAGRQDRGHDRVLGRHHAGLVEEDALAAQPAVGVHLVALPEVDPGAHPREGVDVRVEPPPADQVAARGRDDRVPEPRQQRAGEEERGAHAPAEFGVELVLGDVRGVHPDLVRAGPGDVGAEVGEQLEHRVDVADPRDVRQENRVLREQRRGEDRQRAVLVAGRLDRPREPLAPFDHESVHQLGGEDARRHRGRLADMPDPTREQAWDTLTRYTTSQALLRHALAVEASVRWYARAGGEDEELWGVTALLHDFDYEIHPTLDKHPQDGAPILREEGYPEEVVEAVLSHAEHLGIPRDTPLKKTLFACDELSGFVHACGLVRPDGTATLEPRSVLKKLRQPSFAAGVHRDEVYAGAELLGLDLDEHIAFLIEAMRPIAPQLGLPG